MYLPSPAKAEKLFALSVQVLGMGAQLAKFRHLVRVSVFLTFQRRLALIQGNHPVEDVVSGGRIIALRRICRLLPRDYRRFPIR